MVVCHQWMNPLTLYPTLPATTKLAFVQVLVKYLLDSWPFELLKAVNSQDELE